MSHGVPVLRIDLNSGRPVYEQIVSGLRALLVAGRFRSGERLPPVRQLAIDLGVHHNTVATSYRVLADEGWLDLARHRGATVRDRPESKPSAGAIQAFARRVQELAAEAIAGGLSRGTAAQQLVAIARQLSKG